MQDRDINGNIVDDLVRFPNGGISYLSNQIHELGLKFGLYSDIGTETCAKYPGLQNHMEQDIYKFVHEYNIDSLKVDGCNADPLTFPDTFPKLSILMNKTASETNRPILLNCIWPLASVNHGEDQLYNIAKYCNYWRNYYDVWDDWTNVRGIIDYFTRTNISDPVVAVVGPGQYNDPDMLLMGNPGLSISEQYIQFALWCIYAAPLFISADLYNMPIESQQILLNHDMIAVNQDILGKAGYCVDGCTSHQRIYIKELQSTSTSTLTNMMKTSTIDNNDNNTTTLLSYTSNSWAIALVNLNSYFGYVPMTFDYIKHLPSTSYISSNISTSNHRTRKLLFNDHNYDNDSDIMKSSCLSSPGFIVRDLMERRDLPDTFTETFTVLVDESSIKMFRITLLPC